MLFTGQEIAAACVDVAKNYKTLYVMGCFGAPMNDRNKARYCKNHSYNKKAARTKKIQAASADTFGFDCVNLIKGLAWGWGGDTSKNYGGASYKVNDVPDVSANGMIKLCEGVTTDFSNIQTGEAVWMDGHIGIYIGGGLAVESTPIWKDGVQITAVGNIGKKAGYNTRTWTKHGKLPFVTYEGTPEEKPATKPTTGATDTKKGDFTVEMRYLKKGCKGEDVRALQILLIGGGYSCGNAGADGDFGSATDKALRKYQKAKGLADDGVAGPDTMRSLLGV